MGGDWILGAVLAFLIATATTPAGVSGAVFLLPVQVSVLGVPSPAVTPTNLLYNVVSTPGGLLRFAREGRLRGPLLGPLVLGTTPGVIAGAVIRVELVPGEEAFRLVIAAVLLPLGLWLLGPARERRRIPSKPGDARVTGLGLVVGTIGGVYGIGGGSILAPLLIGLGYAVREVAPPALAATFVTSVVGAATYALLSLSGDGSIAPDWVLGVFMGVGGLIGSYTGARLQPGVPEVALRRLAGGLAVLIAARYVVQAIL
jgi:uncharacterized membrane protein YfcA